MAKRIPRFMQENPVDEPKDTWGNTYNKNFAQKDLERQRKLRHKEIVAKNTELEGRVVKLQDSIMDLEDIIVDLKVDIEKLKDDLTVAEAAVISKARAPKTPSEACVPKAPKLRSKKDLKDG